GIATRVLDWGKKSFYQRREGGVFYFDAASGDYKEVPSRLGVTILKSEREREKVIKKNASATLIDIGDGVACLEFHSKMNAIGADTIAMMNFAVKEVGERF